MRTRSRAEIEFNIGGVAAALAIGSVILHLFDETATGKGTMIKLFLIVIMSLVALAVVAIVRKPNQ